MIFPAAIRYQGELVSTCANLKAIGAPKFGEKDKAFARRLQQPLIEQFGTKFPRAIDERVHPISLTSKPSKGSTDVSEMG